MFEAECPFCGEMVELPDDIEDGDEIVCTNCNVDLIVLEAEDGEFVLEEA